MRNRRLFISIFAMSLAVTLLVSPVKVFNNPVVETIEVQAEEEPITDTQRGVALLMTIMLAQGLRFVGDWNTVVQPGLQKLWEDFSTATGNAVTLPMLVAGSSLALGYIRTSNSVNNAIANFTAWYTETFSQPITGEVDVPLSTGQGSTFTVFNIGCSQISLLNEGGTSGYRVSFDLVSSSSAVRGLFLRKGYTYYFYLVSQNPFTVQEGSRSLGSGTSFPSCPVVTSTTSASLSGNYYYWFLSDNSGSNTYRYSSNCAYHGMSSSENNATTSAIYYTFGEGAVIDDVSMEGQSLELKDGYQLESDQAKLYDIAGLEALVASLALTLENIDDLVRDIPLIYDTPWSLDYPDNPAYVDTPDDTIPWVDVPDSVIPADTPEYVPTIPSERDEYKVLGLDQVFPFSIPFDLYYLSQVLVSDPQTPEFQYAAVNPVNGNLLTIDVDLHDFDGVASIFRTCETVLFIAFLIWITRSLIRS